MLKLVKYKFPKIIDEENQGVLHVFESDKIPFKIKRIFTVVNAYAKSKRGEHAHKVCNQLLVCLSGEIELLCDDGKNKETFLLESGGDSIWVPSGVWAEQTYNTNNSVLLVICDKSFDEDDYIRDYDEFIKWKKIS